MTVSVLITYYNEREMLTACLDSLRQQSALVDEILIYDDASSHPPESYIPEGVQCRVIRGEENRGPAHGRNALLKEARGDYVHFHDSDDWFHPDWWRLVRAELETASLDVVFTDVSCVHTAIPAYDNVIMNIGVLASRSGLAEIAINYFLLVPSGTYKRELVLRIGGYDPAIWQSEDYDFHLRLAAEKVAFSVIDQPLVCIRRHQSNRSLNELETTDWAVRVLEKNNALFPDALKAAVSRRMASFARRMYQLKSPQKAAEVFVKAARLSPRCHDDMPLSYRCAARLISPMAAEWLSQHYRLLLPEGVRRFFATRRARRTPIQRV